MLDGKPFEVIDEAGLRQMIEDSEPESRTLDYKRDTYGTDERSKKEFVKDVASFANTLGGHLVIGMDEERGIASDLIGLDGDADQECLRLENLARAGLQPRLHGLRIRSVLLASGKSAIVVRIPRSLNPPHRVVTGNSNSFWARDGSGKYEPDVDQLRGLFGFASRFEERVTDFRLDRVAKTKAGEGLVTHLSDGVLLLHIIPQSAFGGGERFDIRQIIEKQSNFRPIVPGVIGGSLSTQINFDGLMLYSGTITDSDSHVQIWKDGRVETIFSRITTIIHDQRHFITNDIKCMIVEAILTYTTGLQALSARSPFTILLSLLEVQGAIVREGVTERHNRKFDRPDLLFSSVVIEDDIDRPAVERALEPVFNDMANAAGLISLP